MHRLVGTIAVLAATLFYMGEAAAQGPQAVTAGELVVEPATLISLGFEWYIEGDTNRNAAVAVAYRQSGESAWHESLPLLRVQNEHTFYVDTLWYVAPNMFAGSVFELKENTEYEVRFKLTDPDGVAGEAERIVKVRTRAEPQAATGGHTYHVYPFDYKGPRQEPAFNGLLGAYYKNSLGGDWSRASPPRVEPGDTHPRTRGPLQGLRPLQLQPRDRLSQHDVLRHAVGRHVLSVAARHGRQTHRDQGRRRRRGHLRRRR